MDKGRKCNLNAEAYSETTDFDEDVLEIPSWEAIRQKIFSFVGSRTRSRSPVNKSPGSKSPVSKSPTGSKSQFNVGTNGRNPRQRSNSRSPREKSPSTRSPTSPSPLVTPFYASPISSPIGVKLPNMPACSRRTSFSKTSRESKSSSGENEALMTHSRRPSANSPLPKKGMCHAMSNERVNSSDTILGTPGPSSCNTTIYKSILKNKNSQLEGSFDIQQMNDELCFYEATRRPRKWSYHGTASPSAHVDVPKRHSFSTVSDHKTGILVTNNDLAVLLSQNKLLLPPGLPGTELPPLPTISNPKARGRSQSIAVCAGTLKQFGRFRPDEPVAPVTIRTTDCDHLPSLQSHDSIESQKEEHEKLLWDSSGSTVNVNLLGSVIEEFLKVTTQEEDEEAEDDMQTKATGSPTGEITPPATLSPTYKGLQVK